MKTISKWTIAAALSGAALLAGQYGPGSDLRGLVDRTQSDLRAAASIEHARGDQRDRYHNAQGHLSTFDRHLVKGHFDKGELDQSIGDIKNILDKNILQGRERDALMQDITDLRAARERHDFRAY